MTHDNVQQSDRRRSRRQQPDSRIRVHRAVPVMPISDAAVLNTSASGVAIKTRVPIKVGDRLSFTTSVPSAPPILAEVLAIDPLDDGYFRVRCRCLLGGFEQV